MSKQAPICYIGGLYFLDHLEMSQGTWQLKVISLKAMWYSETTLLILEQKQEVAVRA